MNNKEVPKKPKLEYIVDEYYYRCSSCGHLIIEKVIIKSISGEIIKDSIRYCAHCGQLLDWGDE